MKLTQGYGCDVYIEAAGSEQSVDQGLKAIRNLGRFVQFGVFKEKISADWNIIGDTKRSISLAPISDHIVMMR
ncbi:Erythritol/L-threitol dehydrogenase [[Clostridium] hylemonae DSM 15053]|nr:Erythritol/L-threitol dehydrogenase [[Clostridium] hylemonae DSM 15053]